MSSKEAASQMEQAFQRGFRMHITSRSSGQMEDAIRASGMMTQEQFVSDMFQVSHPMVLSSLMRARSSSSLPLVARQVCVMA